MIILISNVATSNNTRTDTQAHRHTDTRAHVYVCACIQADEKGSFNWYKLVPDAAVSTATTTTTPNPGEAALDRLNSSLSKLDSALQGASTTDKSQDQALKLAQAALVSSGGKVQALELQLERAHDLVAK